MIEVLIFFICILFAINIFFIYQVHLKKNKNKETIDEFNKQINYLDGAINGLEFKKTKKILEKFNNFSTGNMLTKFISDANDDITIFNNKILKEYNDIVGTNGDNIEANINESSMQITANKVAEYFAGKNQTMVNYINSLSSPINTLDIILDTNGAQIVNPTQYDSLYYNDILNIDKKEDINDTVNEKYKYLKAQTIILDEGKANCNYDDKVNSCVSTELNPNNEQSPVHISVLSDTNVGATSDNLEEIYNKLVMISDNSTDFDE